MKCKRPNCPRAPKVGGRGYCPRHYPIYRRENPISIEACAKRLNELHDAGYSYKTIAQLSGVNLETIQKIARRIHKGEVIRLTHERIMSVSFPKDLHEMSPRHAPWVSGVGTRRRLQGLAAAGHSLTDLGKRLGVTPSAISYWAVGDKRVTAVTHARIKKLFEELQMLPAMDNREARNAKRKGWVPAWAWDEDEIDDPNALPHMVKGQKGDWLPRMLEYKALGMSVRAMAQMEGVSPHAIHKRLERMGDAAA